MTAEHRSEGNTGVLESPGIDIAELVGNMPVKACECTNSYCCGSAGCDRAAEWMVRRHVRTRSDGKCREVVRAICTDCLNAYKASVSRFTYPTTCRICHKFFRSPTDAYLVVPL